MKKAFDWMQFAAQILAMVLAIMQQLPKPPEGVLASNDPDPNQEKLVQAMLAGNELSDQPFESARAEKLIRRVVSIAKAG